MLGTDKDNINNGYIDMHCHIIPNVDDGAKSLEQAMNMISIAYQNGFRTMIGTPHYEVGRYEANKEEIENNYLKLKNMLKERMPD